MSLFLRILDLNTTWVWDRRRQKRINKCLFSPVLEFRKAGGGKRINEIFGRTGARSNHWLHGSLTFVFLRLWGCCPSQLVTSHPCFPREMVAFPCPGRCPCTGGWETQPSGVAYAHKDKRSLALIKSSPAGRLPGRDTRKGNEGRKFALDILLLWEGEAVKVSWVKCVINLKQTCISPPALPPLGTYPGGIPKVELPRWSFQGFKEGKIVS